MASSEDLSYAFLEAHPGQDKKYARAKLQWVNEFVMSGIPSGEPIGYHDTAGWRSTKDYLRDLGLLSRDVPLSSFVSYDFLDKSIIPR